MGLNASDIMRLGPAARAQVLQKIGAAAPGGKKTKYHNEPARRGDLRFDSQKEARRYDELMLLLKAGDIRNLRLQAQFTLKESYISPSGLRVRAIRYVADFAYERRYPEHGIMDCYSDELVAGIIGCSVEEVAASRAKDAERTKNGWYTVVEDVKSTATKTAQYEMKKKLLHERFGLEITEV